MYPCHRIIGSNHKLTGYGGGLDAKKGLLELGCSNNDGNTPYVSLLESRWRQYEAWHGTFLAGTY